MKPLLPQTQVLSPLLIALPCLTPIWRARCCRAVSFLASG